MSKYCPLCDRNRSTLFFHKHSSSKDKLDYYCRDCKTTKYQEKKSLERELEVNTQLQQLYY